MNLFRINSSYDSYHKKVILNENLVWSVMSDINTLGPNDVMEYYVATKYLQ